jgi:hypothetical protein
VRLADGAAPCDGWADIAAPVAPPIGGHNKCTDLVLAVRCMPAGSYAFVVEPSTFTGVDCGVDYKITLNYTSGCEACTLTPPCPAGAYQEGTYSDPNLPADPAAGYCDYFDPNGASWDPENGGCNVTPNAFEPLPYDSNQNPHSFTFCGKLWANQGSRDRDWYSLDLPYRAQIQYSWVAEMPTRAATIFFNDAGILEPPTCENGSFWFNPPTINETPCTPSSFTDTQYYEPGLYYFLVLPESGEVAMFYGYPCPMGGTVDLGNDYQVTMTVTAFPCDADV